MKAGACTVSVGGKATIQRLAVVEIVFFEKAYQAVAKSSCISLTCL